MAPVTSLSNGNRRTQTKTAAVLLRLHLPPLYLNIRPCPQPRQLFPSAVQETDRSRMLYP